jgi:hypothetical protein
MRIVKTTGNWKAKPIRAEVTRIWERKRLTSKKLPMDRAKDFYWKITKTYLMIKMP